MKNFYFGFSFLLLVSLTSCKLIQKGTITDFEISTSVLKQATTPIKVYQQLVDRFVALDTLLTEKEMKLLYYGQLVMLSFSAYDQPRLSEVEQDIRNKQLMSADEKLDSILIKHPMNLTANFLKTFVSIEIDPADLKAKKRVILLNRLYDAILSTGDGESKKNAIDVVCISDEYFVCYNILYTGEVNGQALIIDKKRVYDKLIVEPSQNYKKKEVWFDISNFFGKLL